MVWRTTKSRSNIGGDRLIVVKTQWGVLIKLSVIEPCGFAIKGVDPHGYVVELGIYKSEERAKEVMQEIENVIFFCKGAKYRMPKE